MQKNKLPFGAKIKELRIRKKQSLQQVADAVKASKAHIWELEMGKSANPSLDLVQRIAEHFRVTVADLIGENPGATVEDRQMMLMYRDMKKLTEEDQKMLKDIIRSMQNRMKKEE